MSKPSTTPSDGVLQIPEQQDSRDGNKERNQNENWCCAKSASDESLEGDQATIAENCIVGQQPLLALELCQVLSCHLVQQTEIGLRVIHFDAQQLSNWQIRSDMFNNMDIKAYLQLFDEKKVIHYLVKIQVQSYGSRQQNCRIKRRMQNICLGGNSIQMLMADFRRSIPFINAEYLN